MTETLSRFNSHVTRQMRTKLRERLENGFRQLFRLNIIIKRRNLAQTSEKQELRDTFDHTCR